MTLDVELRNTLKMLNGQVERLKTLNDALHKALNAYHTSELIDFDSIIKSQSFIEPTWTKSKKARRDNPLAGLAAHGYDPSEDKAK